MLETVSRFFKSLDFLKGIVMAIAMLIPIFIANFFFNDVHLGISVAMGVLFCAPTDVPGSNKHVFFGIVVAIFLSFSLTLLFGSIATNFWLLIPTLGVVVFAVSYISVFGFRASLISFVGILAIVLSFTNDYSETDLFQHACLIVLGGFWYLLLAYLKSRLFPKFQTDQLFIKTIDKTAAYLKIRGELFINAADRDALFQKLFELHFEINQLHETIREIILTARHKSGFSNKTRRRQLLFSDLVDMLELAIANPVDYEKFDEVFVDHKEKIIEFQLLVNEIASQLEHISKVIRKEEKLKINTKIPIIFKKIERNIDLYRILVGMPKARKGTLMMLNLKSYQEKQLQNLTSIERVLNNYTRNEEIISHKDADRFLTPIDYDYKKLIENFSFNSPIFKHSLRLAIVTMIGFGVGRIFSMQNPYWIVLTIAVIMRPSFGLTKTRTIHRVIGTLIGATIAIVVIFITQNPIVYGTIGVLAMPLAFSLVQLNYRNAAVFITLHVVFVYALFEPNILSVIQFRIIDTLIGAGLAFTATYVLWPSWEFQNIHEYFIKAMQSNLFFLKEIASFYHKKGKVSTTYKVKRKAAFLNIANLNSAFQRLNQDPKSKQVELSTIYEITVFNNTFLSSLTSLGTYFRNNKTSKASEAFDVYIENICSNLKVAIGILEENEKQVNTTKITIEEAEATYDSNFSKLSDKRDSEIAQGEEHSPVTGAQLKEALLVSEQLKWLYKLSEKLIVSCKKYQGRTKPN